MARRDVLSRTVADLSAHVQWVLLAERGAEREGFLQAVAPPVKLAGTVVLVVLAVTRATVVGAVALCALAAALAASSRVPPRALVGRVAGPTAMSLVVVAPQAVLISGPSLAGTPLTVPGSTYVGLFVCRVAAAAALLATLATTTPVSTLLAGARRLRVPRTAVALVGITYRYLLVFFAELGRMVRARRARQVRRPSLRETWDDSGSFLGTFMLRTLGRGERVQRAARARGGGGVAGYDRTATLRGADVVYAAVVLAAVTAVVLA
ncbi:cobalt ECF transporter T component CbiQ [Halobacteriales archaeon SW_7_68_16]|nr:MAG: cobalt ECF transporter T component CbiQ [Halobacteriales archaeon SW_7_68_16]